MRREDLKTEILRALSEQRAYGYEIAKRFREERGSVHTGYLYGVLREMEKEGLLQSEWEKGASGPPRRTYGITQAGKESLQLGLMLKEKQTSQRGFPQIRMAAALGVLALVLTDIVQYVTGGSLLAISIPAGVAVLVFAAAVTFISLRRSGGWVGWLLSTMAFLVAISVVFPPHPAHTWQGTVGLVLALVGVVKLRLGLALLGFSLMLGSFVFHQVALQIDEGLLHDVYTSSAWLAMFAAGIGVNALLLYVNRGRVATLGEVLSFGKSPILGGLVTAEESRIVRAPKELVWKVLTDMENWPKWLQSDGGFRVLSHHIVATKDNVIIADEISEMNGRRVWSRDKYTLYPEEKIEETFIEGPLRGRMVLTVHPTHGGTRVGILAEVKFKGVARLGSLFGGRKLHKRINDGILNALARAVET